MKKIIKDEIYLDFYFSMLWLLRNRASQTAMASDMGLNFGENIPRHQLGIRDLDKCVHRTLLAVINMVNEGQ